MNTPQHTVHIVTDYRDTRVISIGVSPMIADDVIVQRKDKAGVWHNVRSFNSLSDDSAYTNARDYARELLKKG